jgi:hypothetical protein
MPGVLAAILSLFLAVGCTAARPEPARIHEDAYERKIRDWQERIRQEGWTDHVVRSVLAECRGMVHYELELKDHWSTPSEFMAAGLTGDCEDIAAFLMASLKRLNYPHQIRILVVRSLFSYHALLKVELPNSRWAVFETVPGGDLEIRPTRFDAVVEFDENVIAYF